MNTDTMQNFVKNEVKWVSPETATLDVFNLMKKSKIHHLPVVKDGKAIGIISDRDVSFVDKTGNALNLTAKDIMTPEPVSVDALTTIPHAIKLMRQNRVNSILVHDENKKVIGIFTSTDALDILAEHYQ
jgi:acetoin utilization protein AcuB